MGPSRAQKPFRRLSVSYLQDKGFSPLDLPEFKRADSNSCKSGKGGSEETREEQSRNNSAALGQEPGPTSRNVHNNIFEFCRN